MRFATILIAAGCVIPTLANAANTFNPDISLILNGSYGQFQQDPEGYAIPGFPLAEETGPGERGFALGESELSMSANIDPDWYGYLAFALTPEGGTEVENAYVQTTSLGNGLTLRAGRFFSGIGYLNEQHAHAWDFADTPLPYRALLGNHYGDDGVQLRWLAPTDLYMEFGFEGMAGGGFPAGGNADEGRGGSSAFVHFGGDVGDSNSWRAGMSYLSTKSVDRATDSSAGTDLFNGDTTVAIADLVWKWAPNGNSYERNFKLQAEYMQLENDGDFTPAGGGASPYSAKATGWYLQAVYQFTHGWRVGLRHDELSADDPGAAFAGTVLDRQGHTPKRNSIMIDYSNSEFSRLRLQYNQDDSNTTSDDQWLLQYQMSLGKHGAHKF